MATKVITKPSGVFLHVDLQHEAKMPPSKLYEVQPEDQCRYGMKGLVVLASSHPSDPACLEVRPTSTWDPVKKLFVVGASQADIEFATVYENKIHDGIVSVVEAALPSANWGLNVFHIGFDTEPLKNPITIHLVVAADGHLTNKTAGEIVADILTVVATARYSDQPIHVDVCRALKSPSSDPLPLSLLDRNPDVYNSAARLPCASVGSVQYDSVGTLSGFIKHTDENGRITVLGLTCFHVICPLYSHYTSGLTKSASLKVTCPASTDHANTIELIINAIDIDTQLSPSEIAGLKETLENAKQYDITFGTVYATSGTGGSLPDSEGRSDWAVISVADSKKIGENKHVLSSGNFVSFKHPILAPLDKEYLHAARKYFDPGPHFKDVRDGLLSPGELVFKPRSRTTNDWIGGTFNGIRSTQKSIGRVTREWCFLALHPKMAMSDRGDSGSIIVDREFRPVALLWGGNEHDFAQGPRDVTYASPLSNVLRDIEKHLGGSVSMA